MKFYEFGAQNAPVILLLPGTCCHWQANFGPVVPLLERDFRVVCVSYDGFDETEQTVFPDMLTETAKSKRTFRKAVADVSAQLTAVLWAAVSWGC